MDKNKIINAVLPYFVMCFVVTGYLLLVFNKYVPVQEGWFQYDCMLMKAGRFPYKDFYLHIPPGFLMLIYSLQELFGPELIVLRFYGVIERVLVSCFIFYILRKQFKSNDAFIATILGVFFYSSFNVDLPYSYYQTTFIISLSTFFTFERALNETEKVSKNYVLAGIFTSIVFITKQSSGMIFLFGLFIIIVVHYLRLTKYRDLLIAITYFISGFVLITTLTFTWLFSENALEPYFNIVFLASKSKGSPTSILFGFIPRMFNNTKLLPVIVTIILLTSAYYLAKRYRKSDVNYQNKSRLAFILYGALAITAYMYAYLNKHLIRYYNLNHFTQYVIILCSLYLLLCLAAYTYKWYKKPQDTDLRSKLFWITFATMWAYSHGMSGVLEAPAFIFGLPLCVLILWSSYINTYFMRTIKYVTILIGISAIIVITSQKYATPFYWWGWGEPDVRSATETSTIPVLKGMRISSRDKKVYEYAYSLINENTVASDEVFFFPHNSLFNVLSKRTYSAYTTVCYFDVCSDLYAKQAAQYLENNKPKMILNMIFPESAWKIHEDVFRGGKLSGQRMIQEVITKMTNNGTYTQIAVLSTIDNYPIVMLKRVGN